MNVFQMYVQNGNRAGFWVQRHSWGNTVAHVLMVAGAVSGELQGEPPYYDDPEVLAEFWRIGADGQRVVRVDIDVLSCPGTYGYRLIDAPPLRRRNGG